MSRHRPRCQFNWFYYLPNWRELERAGKYGRNKGYDYQCKNKSEMHYDTVGHDGETHRVFLCRKCAQKKIEEAYKKFDEDAEMLDKCRREIDRLRKRLGLRTGPTGVCGQ